MSYTTYIATSNAFILKWISEHLQFVWIYCWSLIIRRALNVTWKTRMNLSRFPSHFSFGFHFLFGFGKNNDCFVVVVVLLPHFWHWYAFNVWMQAFIYIYICCSGIYMSHKLNVPAQNNYFKLISNVKYEK